MDKQAIEDITKVLNDFSYEKALDLFHTHGKNTILKRNLAKKDTDYTREKLRYELEKLIGGYVPQEENKKEEKEAAASKKKEDKKEFTSSLVKIVEGNSIPYDALPDILKKEYDVIKEEFKEFAGLHAAVKTEEDTVKRQKMVERICYLNDRQIAFWGKFDLWKKEGVVPEEKKESVFDITTANKEEREKRKRANKAYLKRNSEDKEKEEECKKRAAEIKQIEEYEQKEG